jgi:iron complex outermembrane receptor protein
MVGRGRACRVGAAALALALLPDLARAGAPSDQPLTALSVEELVNLEVTTVSKKAEPRLRAAAAVYVITREEILRSGATTIPEALRLAPGVEVARLDSHTWAISIRGFNSTTANKLLVLLDGRSLYTPLYSGVFWDVQDTLLEDVERIEVVAGPGGALWGANAVNGVINIITRRADESQGGLLAVGGGTEERAFGAARYGGRLGERAHARGYLKGSERGADVLADGRDAGDAWRSAQGGFRVDWQEGDDALTAQGDAYSGKLLDGATGVGGGNLLARWERTLSARDTLQVQAYWDHTDRRLARTLAAHRDTWDVDLQHHLALPGRHDVVWGLGWRVTSDDNENSAVVAFLPARRTDHLFSAFAQDEIALWGDRASLTLGSKVEHNDYTGFEVQPSLRLATYPSERQTWWAALSRAVRTPSRLDSDLVITSPIPLPGGQPPAVLVIRGDPDIESEKLLAYEAGWRLQPTERVLVDLALFHNRYTDLRSNEPEPTVVVPTPTPHILFASHLANGLLGTARGATLAVQWSAGTALLLRSSYTRLDLDLHARAGSTDRSTARSTEGSSPHHQLGLASYLTLPRHAFASAVVRWVDELPAVGVDDYASLDVALGWQPSARLELSLVGQDLLDDHHREFARAGSRELQRGVYLKAAWRF